MQTQEMSLHTEDLSSSWGLPPGSAGLRGGGLSSLNNNGTSGWGAPPSATAAATTGWGAPPGSSPSTPGGSLSVGSGSLGGSGTSSSSSPPSSSGSGGGVQSCGLGGLGGSTSSPNNNHPGGSNQWGSPSPNRLTSQISNGQPTISGSQMNNNPSTNATNVPPNGSSMQLTNPNLNSSNNPMNPGSGSTNPSQVPTGCGIGAQGHLGSGAGGCSSGGLIPNSGTSSWAQAAGKSLQGSGGIPPNPPPLNPTQQQQQGIQGQGIGSGVPQQAPTNNPMNPPILNSGSGVLTSSTTSSVTSKQIEQLNSMREALFSTDGWGGQNVNQESSWDVPGSPEPHHKDGVGALGGQVGGGTGAGGTNNGSGSWKLAVNNGTDLWEANLRGGAPPPQPITQKVPWGHTPTTNHGGTWGEEDESDNSNVWNGIPPAGSNNIPAPNATGQASDGGGRQSQQWMGGISSVPPQIQQTNQVQPNREPSNNPLWSTPQTHPMKKENSDWANIGSGVSSNGSNSNGIGRGGDQQGPGPNNWGGNPTERGPNQGRGLNNMNNGGGMDQSQQGMWNKPPPQQHQQQQPNPQWGTNGPTGDVGHMGSHHGGGGGPKEKGWDEISPPAQRRIIPNIPNYDDGTSLWGNTLPGQQQQQQHQQQPQQQPPQRGMSANRGGMPNKMDGNPMWTHGGGGGGSTNGNRNGWQNQGPPNIQQGLFNGTGGDQHGGWNDEKLNSWGGDGQMQGQQQQQQHNSWGKPKTPTNQSGQGGWGDDGLVDTSNWGAPPKNPRYLNGSKSFHHKDFWANGKPTAIQLLSDMGCKKDDLDQLSLRTSSMHLSDAIDNLDMGGMGSGRGGVQMDALGTPWGMGGGNGPPIQSGRRAGPDDHFDMSGLGVAPNGPIGGNNSFMNRGGSGGGGGFPGNSGGFPGAGNSLSNNMMGNPNLGGGMNPMLQKMLSQQQQQQQQPQAPALQFPFNSNNVRGGQAHNSPSSTQLKMLVQQIQMAVQAGYLNSQILQHPLPQQSLYLLNQLLGQIKIFQQLTQAQHQMSKSTNSATALNLNVQITKTKQSINNLHNQISAQQANHAKEQQQQQQQHQQHRLAASSGVGSQQANSDFYSKNPVMNSNPSSNVMDPMLSLQSNFGQDFGLKDPGPVTHQTSRLTQWTRVPSLEKDDDFSRAPGPQTNNASGGLLKNNSSLILGQSDNSTWSTGVQRSGGDGWPTDSSVTNPNDDSGSKGQLGANNDFGSFGDLVPEFEPGKPWKGNSILKSVEDDPTLTPGSVVRSPLSLAAIKDASEIFNKQSQPTSSAPDTLSNSTPLSLSSNTWSFTPAGTTTMANSMAKLNTTKSWGDEMGGGSGRARDPWEYSSSSVGQGGGGGGNRPPPGMGLPQQKTPSTGNPSNGGNFGTTQNSSFNSYRNNTGGGQQQQQQQQPTAASWGSNPGNGHYWLLLRNLTPQIDGSTLKTLCQQHGPLTKFHLYLNHGIALVKYSTQVTQTAQNALNNCVLGNTTILAETASETDVFTLMSGLNGGASAQSSSGNSGFGGSGKQTGSDNPWGVSRNPSKGSSGQWDLEHRDNSPLWNSPWGSSSTDAPDRSTPSSLNNLLPGDLLHEGS